MHNHTSSFRCSIFAGIILWYESFTSCCCDLMAASGMSREINTIMTSLSQAATVLTAVWRIQTWENDTLAKHKEKKGVCGCYTTPVLYAICWIRGDKSMQILLLSSSRLWDSLTVKGDEMHVRLSPSVMLTLGNCTLISIRIIDTLN